MRGGERREACRRSRGAVRIIASRIIIVVPSAGTRRVVASYHETTLGSGTRRDPARWEGEGEERTKEKEDRVPCLK